ncbi:hypothetical protein JL09_g6035 [Pichia kudriavzevii]|nr:hypothetical protein JL09_g6035 [Pichia kudriavzevii]
MLPKEK